MFQGKKAGKAIVLSETLGVADIRRAINLDKTILKQLSNRNTYSLLGRFTLDIGIIVFIACLSEYFSIVTLYPLIVSLIGARQLSIASYTLHDGGHGLLFKNKRLNDRFAKLVYGSLYGTLLMNFNTHRRGHLVHHKTINTETDPDMALFKILYHCPSILFVGILLYTLTGLVFITYLFRYIATDWRKAPAGVLMVCVSLYIIMYGTFEGYYLALIVLKYWIVPLATWVYMANMIRATAEHFVNSSFMLDKPMPKTFLTRDIKLTLVDRLFIVPYNGVNFHLSHHLYPEVPFYNLAKLQHILSKNDVYKQYAHVINGYHSFFKEYFSMRIHTSFRETLKSLPFLATLPRGSFDIFHQTIHKDKF